MVREVEYTDEFGAWRATLSEVEDDAMRSAVEVLEEDGPALGRSLVDTVHGSRHAQMKDLRAPTENIRILFALAPHRTAILLIGGDKTHRWPQWY